MKTVSAVMVSTTLPTAAKAAALARAVVSVRLAACAHLVPLRSVYWWKGRLERGAEVAVQFKTRRALARRLMAFIRERHSYEVPEIVVTPILDGWPDYLVWIDRETADTPRRLPGHTTRARARRSVPLQADRPPASLTSRPARPRKSLSGKRRAP